MYTFKARCLSSTQSSTGEHRATFQAETGEAVVPSKDALFEVGSDYSFSVDGKLKNVVKPAPAAAPKPAPPVASTGAPASAGAVKPVTKP